MSAEAASRAEWIRQAAAEQQPTERDDAGAAFRAAFRAAFLVTAGTVGRRDSGWTAAHRILRVVLRV